MASLRRATDLRASLMRELDSVSQREGFDHVGRLLWLRGELENYLDRWLAFAAVESISIKSLLSDDLFVMVSVASEVYDQQLGGSGPAVDEWRRFHSALSHVRRAKDRAALVGLREALVTVGVALREKTG